MKFKVGEKVKVVKEGSHGQDIGTICEITKIDKENTDITYLAKCPNGIEMWFYEKQLGKMQFTKSDLKDRDIVTYRNGNQRTLEGIILIDQEGFRVGTLKSYDDNLKHINITENDIIKVERPIKCETVYERKEEILDEAEKRYLRDVIRPFRDKVGHIRKQNFFRGDYITINVKHDDGEEGIDLPYFNKNTMYKGMKLYNKYTLEELRTVRRNNK